MLNVKFGVRYNGHMRLTKSRWNFRRTNHMLSLVIVVLAVYIIVWPFLPSVNWWVQHEAPLVSAAPQVDMSSDGPRPQQNTLVIPSLGMTEQIHEGPGESTLNKGVWRRPSTSTPDAQSNTVLSGHRFTYSGKSVFYYLDKVKVDDQIYVFWEGKRYIYQVTQLLEVSPDRTEIEAPTTEPQLTIYTCTPVWSAKNRLVIQTKLVGVD